MTDENKNHYISCAQPIFSEGDVIGCVVALTPTDGKTEGYDTETETKLVQTAAVFLGKQLEM